MGGFSNGFSSGFDIGEEGGGEEESYAVIVGGGVW